jgi:hypothetical protein
MFVADNPCACGPRIALSASPKSPVEIPCRYSAGINASTLGTRRIYGGRIRLVKASPGRWSSTRGCWTLTGPIPVWIARSGFHPLRTTKRCPAASVAPDNRCICSATSISIAACSIRCAPSLITSSSIIVAGFCHCASVVVCVPFISSVSFLPVCRRVLSCFTTKDTLLYPIHNFRLYLGRGNPELILYILYIDVGSLA